MISGTGYSVQNQTFIKIMLLMSEDLAALFQTIHVVHHFVKLEVPHTALVKFPYEYSDLISKEVLG